LKINEGEIFGFLGPNGAGKTTTIRLLLHLIKPTKGEIFIFGKKLEKNYVEILENIGYLPGNLSLYEKMTGKQLLNFSKTFYEGFDKKFTKKLIERLNCDVERPFKNLSSGNKQKIGILLALFHKPKILILDEPTIGLDPLIQNEFYKILSEIKKEGTTIFFSSHNLPEVEKICDRIGIIKEGRLIEVETIEEIRSHRKKEVEIYFKEKYQKEKFLRIKDVELIDAQDYYLHLLLPSTSINQLLVLLKKYNIKDINFSYPDLEEIFLKYYEKEK
jgi:ABC-2 type transport system ATP-binding protein